MKPHEEIRSQKTTSQTYLSNGTKISTTIILESNPNTGGQVETTTVVKEYVTEKEMEGQILVEEVTETTVTEKRMMLRDKEESCEERGNEVEVQVGGLVCGNDCYDDDESSRLTMDTTLNLDTFSMQNGGADNNKSLNVDPNTNTAGQEQDVISRSVAANGNGSNNGGRGKLSAAASALALFTAPSAFFRKTHPNTHSNEVEIEVDEPTIETEVEQNAAASVAAVSETQNSETNETSSKNSEVIDLGDESLSIVKRDQGNGVTGRTSVVSATVSVAASNASSKQAVSLSQKTEQHRQTCQAVSSPPTETEDRQDVNAAAKEECDIARSSPDQYQQDLVTAEALPTLQPPTPNTSSPKPKTTSNEVTPNQASPKPKKKKTIVKPTIPKHKQTLLAQDSDFASPKLTLTPNIAAVTDDKCLHFFSYQPSIPIAESANLLPESNNNNNPKRWRKSTTVSIENTYCMNVLVHGNTAVVGVPYDRNIKGLLTGAAYIFERQEEKDIWTQVKKIVPKDASEFATVGYSVGLEDNLIVVGVPNIGCANAGPGSVHIYRRVQKYKWCDKGALYPPTAVELCNAGIVAGKKDVQITAVNKTKTKGYLSTKKKFGARVAVQGRVVVVSDHYDHDETSVYVFEYDDFSLKWVCVQDDLLSKAQQRHFGSRLALTNDGRGLLIGCNAKMSPTEILYYSRYGTGGKFRLQQVIVVSKRSKSHGVGRGAAKKNLVTEDIADFKVDGKNLLIGTEISGGQDHQHCVYIYQLQENDTWVLMARVNDPSLSGFGQCVDLAGNRALIASRGNAYSYDLDSLVSKSKRKQFVANSEIAADKSKKKQPKSQIKYIEPDYLELPYTGSNLNEFRNQQQLALRNEFSRAPPANGKKEEDDDKSYQKATPSPSRVSMSMTRPKAGHRMSSMLRMRSPSPILRRMKGSSPKNGMVNASAPSMRPTCSSMAQH